MLDIKKLLILIIKTYKNIVKIYNKIFLKYLLSLTALRKYIIEENIIELKKIYEVKTKSYINPAITVNIIFFLKLYLDKDNINSQVSIKKGVNSLNKEENIISKDKDIINKIMYIIIYLPLLQQTLYYQNPHQI